MKLCAIADHLEGELHGPGELEITGVALPDHATPADVVFIEKQSYLDAARGSKAGAFLIDKRFGLDDPRPYIATPKPRFAFIKLLQLFEPRKINGSGIHPTVKLGKECMIHPSAAILAGCILGERVVVGESVVIHPLCYLGDDVVIGAHSILHAHVVIHERCEVGRNCLLASGVVLGADGFGYYDEGAVRYRIPHLGRVVLADGVEVGANTTIDRAVLGATYVGPETKIDNLVQVGHNCKIGDKCYLVAQVGIGGSTTLGKGVTVAGQAGVSDHLKIGDGATVAGKSAVRESLQAGEIVGGIPALPIRLENEVAHLLRDLPELVRRVERLERSGALLKAQDGHRNWKEEVLSLLARNLRVKPEAIGKEMDLKEEFNADSLTVLSVVAEIESRFHISIPDQDIRSLRTLGSILAYLENRIPSH